jgi:hypothetical protein
VRRMMTMMKLMMMIMREERKEINKHVGMNLN